ncbi:hypothetical protein BGZ95_010727 [Linnemannia exigua]|uniref:Cytochrome b5 heme-binding domain-containing protein n=1 Tax=Linnemannia exigua TaxID=604196 RepID=A0AAD4DCP4_9FUNG|nr:hypothetical protein BGZ95_010727 [Linnemannia exigua]
MSYLLSAFREYVLPTSTANAADSSNESSSANAANNNNNNDNTQIKNASQNDTLAPAPAPHPYANNSNSNRILVQPQSNKPKNTLAIPTVSLNSLQPPSITTNNSSDDSDSDSDSENDSEIKIATPYLTTTTTIDTPFMTLSTADDPDVEVTPSFPALNGPQRLAACSTDPKSKRRIKFALAPGHSPLDWARLTGSGKDLRGVDSFGRYTLEDVKQHKSYDDAWTVLNGKVYNMTAYLPFHPGGEKEIMRCAGRDGTRLFNLTHKWVNYEYMLKECQVGFLVADGSSSNKLRMTVQANKNNSIKYPTKFPAAVFLDSGGVINDNARRAPQWVRYLGEYLPTTVLGGDAQIWGLANMKMIGPFFRRWHEFMDQATQLASQAQARAAAAAAVDDGKQEEDETNVYRIFERLHLLVWIKEMCLIASPQIPDLASKILPTLTDDALFHIAKSAHKYTIQRVQADFPGAVKAIREIKSSVGRLYTSSADGAEDLEVIMKGLGVFEEFDGVYGSDRVDCLKNSEEYYRRVFEAVGVQICLRREEEENEDGSAGLCGQQGQSKEEEEEENVENDEKVEVVVVDDSVKALKWAREHGARTVLITSVEEEQLDLTLDAYRHIDYQLKALSDLPVLLDSWKAHFSCQEQEQ